MNQEAAIRHPRWSTAAQDRIDCEFDHPDFGSIGATLAADDAATAPFFARAVDGEFGPIAPFAPPPLAPITAADVQTERTRRLAAGFDYDFGGERGVHRIGTSAEDRAGWDEVTKIATAACLAGAGDAPIGVETDTGPVQITAAEWQLVLVAAGAWGQPIWHASFALQKLDPIPADFADDAYWS